MKLTRHLAPEALYRQVEPFLLADEAAHNLLLGLCADLMRDIRLYGDQPYMAAVTDVGRVAAVALMTPPHNLTLSRGAAPEALDLVAADLAAVHPTVPGVSGPDSTALRFAEIWSQWSGQAHALHRAMRIYQLDEVRPVQGVPGAPRRAAASDRTLVARWIAAFQREALGEGEASQADIEAATERWLTVANRTLYLWEDGAPVAMAGAGGPTPHGIRISAVYTPPELRRRGYASAVVAAASQDQLDSGRRFCFLFTDLANPTSNHIYQQIGYAPVCDVDEYRFEPA